MVCTFFGHRDTPSRVEGKLREAICSLIDMGIDMFYVGDKGNFDHMARRVLKEMKLNYRVVLAYMPGKRGEFDLIDYSDTIYPETLADVPLRFAISKRNEWMIDRSDFVITYVQGVTGGAAKFKEVAERKGKKVINLAETE